MGTRESQLFFRQSGAAPIGIIATEGAKELAQRIDSYLIKWAREAGIEKDSFLIDAECPRFSSGDAKGLIRTTVRGMDLYFVIDVGNYSIKYNLFGQPNSMSPDDHFQDLLRLIQAAGGKAHRLNVIMPMLYGGRQHRRSYRESLDCAFMLQTLQNVGVQNLITFDAHDPRVMNAVPLMGFDNVMPTYQVLKCMFKHVPDLSLDRDHFMIVSPDEGAMQRNMFYASVMGVDLGMFYKRRDYSRIVNGKNPIVAHEYLGASVEGKTIFIADDIISSGESMLDAAHSMKERGATNFFCFATFALFTNGLAAFDKAYEEGVIDGVFGTNLTYCPDELKQRPWFHQVDVAKYAAYYISAVNHEVSIGSLIDPHAKVEALLAKKRAAEKEQAE